MARDRAAAPARWQGWWPVAGGSDPSRSVPYPRQVPARPPSRLRSVTAPRAAAAALLALSLAVGGQRLPGLLSDQSRQAGGATGLTRVDDLPVLPGVGARATRFLALVRRTVPPDEPVRIVQPITPTVSPLENRRAGEPGSCGYQTVRIRYFWLQYAIYPRPSTCDTNARWTLYFGVRPPALPAGAAVYRGGPDLVLVRR